MKSLKSDKLKVIEHLEKILFEIKNIYIIDMSGISANQNSEFRRFCYSYGAKVQVVKNTFLIKAMKKIGKKWTPIFDVIKGNTALITSKLSNVPAKLINDFQKKTNRKKPSFKAAYFEDNFYIGQQNFETLVNFKSHKEIIVNIIFVFNNTLYNVIYSLQYELYNIILNLKSNVK